MGATTQRGFEVELPIGLPDAGGRRHHSAVLRKMRGHEEALLYDRNLDSASLVSHLLAGTLLRVGEVVEPGPEVVEGMYTADRNHLLLQLRRITLGDELSAGYTCPACGRVHRAVERLDELPFRSLADDEDPDAVTVELEDGFTDRRGDTHTTVLLRLPRGSDEAFVAGLAAGDPVGAGDALLLRCVERFGTLPEGELQAYGLRILRDLTLGDRLRLRRALDEDAPGTRLQRTLGCDGCGARYERPLDVTDFFVPC